MCVFAFSVYGFVLMFRGDALFKQQMIRIECKIPNTLVNFKCYGLKPPFMKRLKDEGSLLAESLYKYVPFKIRIKRLGLYLSIFLWEFCGLLQLVFNYKMVAYSKSRFN